mmetsp:Transcript_88182/g.166175  ORF Transcript_88182/g.166175 Transcript_88182/m.166175 type:complete len:263 (+) Transcript_88182:287-1075(+)
MLCTQPHQEFQHPCVGIWSRAFERSQEDGSREMLIRVVLERGHRTKQRIELTGVLGRDVELTQTLLPLCAADLVDVLFSCNLYPCLGQGVTLLVQASSQYRESLTGHHVVERCGKLREIDALLLPAVFRIPTFVLVFDYVPEDETPVFHVSEAKCWHGGLPFIQSDSVLGTRCLKCIVHFLEVGEGLHNIASKFHDEVQSQVPRGIGWSFSMRVVMLGVESCGHVHGHQSTATIATGHQGLSVMAALSGVVKGMLHDVHQGL